MLTETNKQRANFGRIAQYQYCADLEEMLYITLVTDECEQAHMKSLSLSPFFSRKRGTKPSPCCNSCCRLEVWLTLLITVQLR